MQRELQEEEPQGKEDSTTRRKREVGEEQEKRIASGTRWMKKVNEEKNMQYILNIQ